jgi:hypothetical protein
MQDRLLEPIVQKDDRLERRSDLKKALHMALHPQTALRIKKTEVYPWIVSKARLH